MKKPWLVLILLAALTSVSVGAYYYFNHDVHYHAGFQVYVNDARVDLSDFKYMHVAPCGIDVKQDLSQVTERVHLHNNNGEVAHIHADGVVWGDLFTSLKYPLAEPVIGYVNGQLVTDILYQSINAYDSAIFFTGTSTNISDKLTKPVTVEAMKAAEAQIENCGT